MTKIRHNRRVFPQCGFIFMINLRNLIRILIDEIKMPARFEMPKEWVDTASKEVITENCMEIKHVN